MSEGTAIFLSALVLASVILYAVTKDRWRWRIGIRRLTITLLALVLLGVLTSAGVYLWRQLPVSLSKQTEYAGLRLGMTQDEVRYVKGYPPIVYGEPDNAAEGWLPVIDTKNLEPGKKLEDYREWVYEDRSQRISVSFDKDQKKIVAIECYSADKLGRCPGVAGIADGSTEQEMIRTLGPPERSRIDGVTKHVHYTKYGAYFLLTKEQVYMLGINDTAYAKR